MRRPQFLAIVGCAILCMVLLGSSFAYGQCEIQSVFVAGSVDTSGAPGGVAVSGSYAYVTSYNYGLDIIDVSDPSSPQIVGSTPIAGEAMAVAVSGQYAYVTGWGGDGLQVVDISEPSAPSVVGSAGVMSSGVAVSVSGFYAYVAAQFGGLQIVDVSNPAAPSIVGSLETGSFTKSFDGVEVRGQYAYVGVTIPWTSGELKIIDISHPASPCVVGSIEVSNPVCGLTISDSYAYLATFGCCGGGLEIVDISEPASPCLAGTLSSPWFPGGHISVAVSGSYAYTSGMDIIDVSNPSSPYMVNSVFPSDECTMNYGNMDVAVSGSFAYVAIQDGNCVPNCGNTGSLRILDVSNPAPLPTVHTVEMPHDSRAVATSGAHVYVATGDGAGASLEIVDHSDPTAPAIVGAINLADTPEDIAVSGSYAYMTFRDYSAGELDIIDVSNPSAPQIAGSVDIPQVPNDVAASGTYVYVVDGWGLHVLDASDPSSASIIGSVDTLYFAQSVTVSGSYAYVADWAGIEIIDISEPTTPSIVGSLTYPLAEAIDLAVSGSYACIVDKRWGLKIADISNPSEPYVVGSLDLVPPSDCGYVDVKVSGSYAFVAMYGYASPLQIVDISDPSAPHKSAKPGLMSSSANTSIAVSGSHAYISDEYQGLEIIQLCPNASGSPTIASTQSSLMNTCDQGTTAPSQSFEVFGSSEGTLSYSVNDNVDWLRCEPFTGGSEGEHDTIGVRYSTSRLLPGTHIARITIADPNASNNPQYIDVTMTVTPVTRTLTTSVSPVGAGTVTGGGEYGQGQTATVQAYANPTWKFDHWEGADITGWKANPVGITMNTDKSVTAALVPVTYLLTTSVTLPGAGTVTGGGEYEHGQVATVQASPIAGWKFDHWEGDDIHGSHDNPEQITMTADKSVTAVFTPIELTHINLVLPSNQSVLTSPPIFSWRVNGGGTTGFAVEFSASPLSPAVWSTYEDGHQIIYDTQWTMPQSLWKKIKRGKTVFWRVRGMDLSHSPLTIIRSDETWSFKKQ
ncbi:hypothetical protein HZA56_00145 [Candidatus Poribacteria bacterium]|nr:hypothetical protein [Candidatus Poribacteria bacterium]